MNTAPARPPLHLPGPDQSIDNPQHVPGGQAHSILLPRTSVIVKPVEDAAEAQHDATVQHQLYDLQFRRESDGERLEYRVAEPLTITTATTTTAADGNEDDNEDDNECSIRKYVADGSWTAARVISGMPDPGPWRWEDILRASRALHRDLREGFCRDEPPFMQRRNHRWAKGDRVAWESETTGDGVDIMVSPYRDIFRQLVSLREPVEVREFAEEIIVADGLLWYGGDEDLVRLVGEDGFRLQMLVRALIFRLVAASEGTRETGVFDEAELGRFEWALRVVRAVMDS
ncbi:hypothetical protein AJ79_02807 [Helicocarpus griseus UAMH5409]|uniref:Aminoglycoside phosphotransferase domain-containing protein n=1 Tax=Helicocarpus griseus UAMH5409 TaxID=1447875 RepID=A0A2B7Y177_9EURO|nr:hypothetical protein AJ79_02807 [Helicocarpus griseus UAMH5409]